jgi:hypothetical protein
LLLIIVTSSMLLIIISSSLLLLLYYLHRYYYHRVLTDAYYTFLNFHFYTPLPSSSIPTFFFHITQQTKCTGPWHAMHPVCLFSYCVIVVLFLTLYIRSINMTLFTKFVLTASFINQSQYLLKVLRLSFFTYLCLLENIKKPT